MYKQLQRLLWHAIYWQGQSEACRKTDNVIQSPFGEPGVMMRMMKAVFRAYSRVDMDGRSIPGSKARRMAALTTRVAAIARVIEYFDQHCDTLFDLPAALRGTKGASILLAEKICAEIKLDGDPNLFGPSRGPATKLIRPESKPKAASTPKAGTTKTPSATKAAALLLLHRSRRCPL
jgi:hypothetical protein